MEHPSFYGNTDWIVYNIKRLTKELQECLKCSDSLLVESAKAVYIVDGNAMGLLYSKWVLFCVLVLNVSLCVCVCVCV